MRDPLVRRLGSWRTGAVAAAVVAGLGLAAWAALDGDDETHPRRGALTPAAGRPNFVVVMTDDQTTDDLRVMANVRRLLGEEGTEFVNSYATTPICCPSRASFHTGQYTHNHGVVANEGRQGGALGFTRLVSPRQTLGVRLQRAGYRTGYVGKYMNHPGSDGAFNVPPGWDSWFEPTAGTTYEMYDYTVNVDGAEQVYGSAPEDFKTDVLAGEAVRFIGDNAEMNPPFFLMLGTIAPHEDAKREGRPENPLAAPRFAERFAEVDLPSKPSLVEEDVTDKPPFLRSAPLVGSEHREATDLYRSRLRSLLAVDEAVGEIVKTLRRTGALEDTVVIFTSDNGFVIGEHGYKGKGVAYEEAVRVPLLMRGPGIPRAERRTQIVGNVDLTATILELAEAPGSNLDGISLLPLLRDSSAGSDRALLLEVLRGNGDRPFKAIRAVDYILIDHRGTTAELYDLSRDPFQLENRFDDRAYRDTRADLADDLARLSRCRGRACR